jgi:CBS domain-containing protein
MMGTLTIVSWKKTALAVYGEKSRWLGAGGDLMACTSANKQYIGIITILDIIVFLSQHPTSAVNHLFSHTRVASIIGSNPEGQSLWMMRPDQPLLFALEPMGKGVHRFLVPVDRGDLSQDTTTEVPTPTSSVPLHGRKRSSSSSSSTSSHTKSGEPDVAHRHPNPLHLSPEYFTLITQSDVVRFLYKEIQNLAGSKHTPINLPAASSDHLVNALKTLTVGDIQHLLRKQKQDKLQAEASEAAPEPPSGSGAIQLPQMETYCWVLSKDERVLPALSTMASQGVPAVPVVDSSEAGAGVIVGTLSTSDFRSFLTRSEKRGGALLSSRRSRRGKGGDSKMDLDEERGEKEKEIEEGDVFAMDEDEEMEDEEDGTVSPMKVLPDLVENLETMSVAEFLRRVKSPTSVSMSSNSSDHRSEASQALKPGSGFVCTMQSRFVDSMKEVVDARVHRLWIVESMEKKVPVGVMSLGDMISGVLHIARVM